MDTKQPSFLTRKMRECYYVVSQDHLQPTVFFVHGYGDDHHHFRELVELAHQQGYRCVTIDLLGHGQNAGIDNVNLDKCVDTLSELLELEGRAVNILVGHSLGGLLVLLASMESKIPVIHRITIEPSITKGDFDFFSYIQEPPIGKGHKNLQVRDKNNKHFYHPIYVQNVRRSSKQALLQLKSDVYKRFEELQSLILSSHLPFDYVYGDSSPGQEHRVAIGRYPNVNVYHFKNAGHWVHLDSDDFKAYFTETLQRAYDSDRPFFS